MEISNHLMFAGMDAVELAKKYGTPLYVYDVNKIRENARSFIDAFQKWGVPFQVAYASKAFSSIAMLQVARQEGLSLDVVSEGELYTAMKADFPAERIHLHGNNKSYDELNMAFEYQIGCIVVDNFYEIDMISHLTRKHGQKVKVLLRITPGIEAHTHDYILTGQEDSKFGFDLLSGQAEQALRQLIDENDIDVIGVHSHIGSQIFETAGFVKAVQKIFEELEKWRDRYHFTASVVNLGGGFGIKYTEEDDPKPLDQYVGALVSEVKHQAGKRNLPLPEIWIEPGRSIVGDAAISLYTIGSTKNIPGLRKYVSVDGGMNDNLRPALYQAKYHAVVANRMNEPKTETVSIAGKCCESGDMLIWDLDVPTVQSGDILAVFSTGAYGYSMANHYNRFPKSAVVFIEDGKDHLVVQRETYKDLVKNDLPYQIPQTSCNVHK
ncbi:diaminopimelate decarboxylase [Melghiribacillus thermohalophilus]|uniref:Diaminopimelate decarboxylase n=1 Tax=Melghiribacillus thermohalophilus TaxID=1324956 RepID=A0A4R3N8D2_9BACI|nr:diaminopimelate decarboxylase [Melghiribacillus thermohalophilus]TCT25633.1 diaminopimelate decarboxylase [Melghiribacillus thermohalophilus]